MLEIYSNDMNKALADFFNEQSYIGRSKKLYTVNQLHYVILYYLFVYNYSISVSATYKEINEKYKLDYLKEKLSACGINVQKLIDKIKIDIQVENELFGINFIEIEKTLIVEPTELNQFIPEPSSSTKLDIFSVLATNCTCNFYCSPVGVLAGFTIENEEVSDVCTYLKL